MAAPAISLQALAARMTSTVRSHVNDISHMARLGACASQPSHIQRDLLNMKALRDLKAPDPSCVCAPVLLQSASRARIFRGSIYFFQTKFLVEVLG